MLALLIVALLMTLVLEFDRSVRLEHRAAGNYRDATAAFYLAKAGLAEGVGLLARDATESVSDNLQEAWALPVETRLGQGTVRISIVDEERFFPINSLVMINTVRQDRVAQFERLLRALQIDDRLADAVIDWIDLNDDARPNGAESSYYGSLTPPYRAHNGPMDSLDELRLIRGVTDDVYRRLAPHLTTVSSDISTNLNTADRLVLGALDPELTPDLIDRVIAERPIELPGDISTILGQELSSRLQTSGFGGGVGIRSNFFTIESEGTVNGVSKVLTMRLDRTSITTLDQAPIWVRTPS